MCSSKKRPHNTSKLPISIRYNCLSYLNTGKSISWKLLIHLDTRKAIKLAIKCENIVMGKRIEECMNNNRFVERIRKRHISQIINQLLIFYAKIGDIKGLNRMLTRGAKISSNYYQCMDEALENENKVIFEEIIKHDKPKKIGKYLQNRLQNIIDYDKSMQFRICFETLKKYSHYFSINDFNENIYSMCKYYIISYCSIKCFIALENMCENNNFELFTLYSKYLEPDIYFSSVRMRSIECNNFQYMIIKHFVKKYPQPQLLLLHIPYYIIRFIRNNPDFYYEENIRQLVLKHQYYEHGIRYQDYDSDIELEEIKEIFSNYDRKNIGYLSNFTNKELLQKATKFALYSSIVYGMWLLK